MLCFLGQNTFGQNSYQAAIEMPEMNIMYRGYPNKIEVAVTNADNSEIELECAQCNVEKKGSGFIVTPNGLNRELYLSVNVKKGNKISAIKNIKYRVMALPVPQLYWGGAQEGSKANIRSTKLFVKYPPEIPLNATFKVISWELQTENDTIKSSGSNLSPAENVLKKIKEPTIINYSVIVEGSDGVRRKKMGSWKVDTWDNSPKSAGSN